MLGQGQYTLSWEKQRRKYRKRMRKDKNSPFKEIIQMCLDNRITARLLRTVAFAREATLLAGLIIKNFLFKSC